MTAKKHSAANTFTESEVRLLEHITTTLLRGGDPRLAVEHPSFANLCRKANTMRQTIERKKAEVAE